MEHQKKTIDTMHVRDFRYLRLVGVDSASTWIEDELIGRLWGLTFPSNAIRLECNVNKGEVLLQQSHNPDSTIVLHFKRGAHVVILGNTFYYFERDLI